MAEFKVADSLEAIMSLARRSNKYIDETLPWVLAKDETKKDRLETVLYNLSEAIRFIGILISPFMPGTAKTILEVTGAGDGNYESIAKFNKERKVRVGEAKPIFARLDELSMSQSELSRRTGISTSTINDWKKKKINPQADKLVVICKALDMSLAELLGDDGTENTGVDYSAEEKYLIECYRRSDDQVRKHMLRYMELIDKTETKETLTP